MNEKEKFLRNQLFTQAVRDAFSTHGYPVYKANIKVSEKRKIEMKQKIKEWLDKNLIDGFRVDSGEIETFRDWVEKSEFSDSLDDKKFRFGIAQKLFSMYAKYLWTANLVKNATLLCPIDGKVNAKFQDKYYERYKKNIPPWTTPEFTKEVFEQVIGIIRENVGDDVSNWELKFFNEQGFS